MKYILSRVWLLLLSISILMISRGVGAVFIGVRSEIENFPIMLISVIQAASYLGFMLAGFKIPKILKNVGHIRVFAVCASISSIVPLLQFLFISPYMWIVTQIIFGFGVAGTYIVIEGWLNEATSNEHRGKIFGIYSLIMTFVSSISPLMVGPISPEGITLFLIISITSSIAFIPVALGAKWTPKYSENEIMPFKELFKRTPFGLVSFMLSSLVANTLFMMFVIYAIREGFSLKIGTYGMMMMGIASAIVTYPLGCLSDKIDRRYIIVGTSIATLLALIFMSIAADKRIESLFLISATAVGGFSFSLYPLIASHINDRLTQIEIISASSWLVLLSSGMGVIGILTVGPLIENIGISSFPYLMIISLSISIMYGIYSIIVKGKVKREDQGSFLTVTTLSNTVLEQDIFVTVFKKKKKKSAK